MPYFPTTEGHYLKPLLAVLLMGPRTALSCHLAPYALAQPPGSLRILHTRGNNHVTALYGRLRGVRRTLTPTGRNVKEFKLFYSLYAKLAELIVSVLVW